MRLRLKVLLVFGLFSAIGLSMLAWKEREFLSERNKTALFDTAQHQSAPFRRFVWQRLQYFKQQLIYLSSFRGSPHIKQKGMGDFDIVGLLQANDLGQWNPLWVESIGTLNGQKIGSDFDVTLVKSIPFSRIGDGEVHLYRLADQKHQPVYALAFAVEIRNSAVMAGSSAMAAALPDKPTGGETPMLGTRAMMVGISSKPLLLTLFDEVVGSAFTTYLFDDRGYIQSHPNPQFVGSLFSKDEVTQTVLTSREGLEQKSYSDMSGEPVFAINEKLDQSNLFLVTTFSTTLLKRDFVPLVIAAAPYVGGALILGMLMLWLVVGSISRRIQRMTNAIRLMEQGSLDAKIADNGSGDEVGELARVLGEIPPALLAGRPELMGAAAPIHHRQEGTQTNSNEHSVHTKATGETMMGERLSAERRLAFDQFIDGLKKMVREPMTSILGQVQLLQGQLSGSDQAQARECADEIETAARKARHVLERLSGPDIGNDDITETDAFDLNEVVGEALTKVDALFKMENIILKKDLKSIPMILGKKELLADAIYQVLVNCQLALRSRSKKEVNIQTDFLGESVYLQILDNGIGMSKDIMNRAFDPFFKSFDNSEGLGLGLTGVRSVIRRHGGEVAIDSSSSTGTTVMFKLPVSAEEKQKFQSIGVKNLATKVASAFKREPSIELPVPPPRPENLAEDEDLDATSMSSLKDIAQFHLGEATRIADSSKDIPRDLDATRVAESSFDPEATRMAEVTQMGELVPDLHTEGSEEIQAEPSEGSIESTVLIRKPKKRGAE